MTTHEMHIQGKVIESFERNNNIIIFTLEGKQKLKTFFFLLFTDHANQVMPSVLEKLSNVQLFVLEKCNMMYERIIYLPDAERTTFNHLCTYILCTM